ncbi:MAG: hypothetical protein J07AB43_02080 [Candidatus Nanosalina sp. J07AB43]|jgi:hypothetical protein|nr:MAG: hypothetical protein J07AB43_02080 [Candidatus Nanosalina sp. J07AB43]
MASRRFNYTEPRTFTFKANVILKETEPLRLVRQDIEESQTKKFNIVYDECTVSRINWVPEDFSTGDYQIKSVVEIEIGPIQTTNSMDDLSRKVHTAY